MGFFESRHHSSTATSERCSRCGTVGTTGLACPNPICREKIGPNVFQAFGDPLIDAGQDISKATGDVARATSKAFGDIGGVFGNQAARDASAAGNVGLTLATTAYEHGGFSAAACVVVGAYIGLIGAPSVIAYFVDAIVWTVLLTVVSFAIFVMCGAFFAFYLTSLLIRRDMNRLLLLVPLLGLATWMTLRIPTAFSTWWSATSFFG